MLFDKETYTARRDRLKRQVKEGLILLFGNNDAPSNYPANVYKYRQDSSFLYFYGQHREGLVGVIDIDNHKEYLIGNGSVPWTAWPTSPHKAVWNTVLR